MLCAEAIVRIQQDFFSCGPDYLVPMTLYDLSKLLDIHESTVSRAISGKYLYCSWGVFPLCDFFSRAVGNTNCEYTQESISAMIKKLINEENKKKPLSDQKISELLVKYGIEISRRTVAKYRELYSLPTASGRKIY